jgi:hypothetical protein
LDRALTEFIEHYSGGVERPPTTTDYRVVAASILDSCGIVVGSICRLTKFAFRTKPNQQALHRIRLHESRTAGRRDCEWRDQ